MLLRVSMRGVGGGGGMVSPWRCGPVPRSGGGGGGVVSAREVLVRYWRQPLPPPPSRKGRGSIACASCAGTCGGHRLHLGGVGAEIDLDDTRIGGDLLGQALGDFFPV